jgi:membrane protease YdiL (CAAX protease family)
MMNTMEQQAIFAIAATVIFSYLYFILLDRLRKRSGKAYGDRPVAKYIARKVSGFLILGALPALLAWFLYGLGPAEARLVIGETVRIGLWIVGASLFFIALNLVNARNIDIQKVYPEMRVVEWGWGRVFLAGGGWLLYLTGYEYLFRGLLLFTCYDAFGLWPAVTINLALYSALHLPKGMKEALAAIPFGALLCYLTLESQSILAAILIHAIQAISCEIFCIWRNPDMKFNLKNDQR